MLLSVKIFDEIFALSGWGELHGVSLTYVDFEGSPAPLAERWVKIKIDSNKTRISMTKHYWALEETNSRYCDYSGTKMRSQKTKEIFVVLVEYSLFLSKHGSLYSAYDQKLMGNDWISAWNCSMGARMLLNSANQIKNTCTAIVANKNVLVGAEACIWYIDLHVSIIFKNFLFRNWYTTSLCYHFHWIYLSLLYFLHSVSSYYNPFVWFDSPQ